jgi:thiol:disulfide interchange protein
MKRFLILSLFAFLGLSLLYKNKAEGGIKFENMSLEKAMSKANKSEKYIFIDAYTSWCGPCKKMAATSFVDPTVGKIFNEKFINLKIDCEKDADGPEISRKYKIKAYPTLLVIDGDGNLVKEVLGFQTADQLKNLASSL